MRVSGHVGQRKIVKFAYDVARELDVSAWDAAAFGIAPLQARVETPHIGSAGSYHLAVVSPAPLDIVDAEISLRRRATPLHNVEAGQVIARCTAQDSRRLEGPLQPEVEDRSLNMYADAVGRQARFYVAGERDGCFGRLLVSITVQLGGSPNEHSLASEFLGGARRLLLLSGLLPILGAGSLGIGGGSGWVEVVASISLGVAVGIAVVLWFGVILPREKQSMPLSAEAAGAGE